MNTITELDAGNRNLKDPQVRNVGRGGSFDALSESERAFLARVRAACAQNPKRMIREFIRLGFDVLTNGGRNGHYRLRHELTGSRVFPFGSSPSDRRFGLNFVREVRWAILARRCA